MTKTKENKKVRKEIKKDVEGERLLNVVMTTNIQSQSRPAAKFSQELLKIQEQLTFIYSYI